MQLVLVAIFKKARYLKRFYEEIKINIPDTYRYQGICTSGYIKYCLWGHFRVFAEVFEKNDIFWKKKKMFCTNLFSVICGPI